MSGGEQDGQQVDLAAAQRNVRAELLVVDHSRPHRQPAGQAAAGRGLVGVRVRGEFGEAVADLLRALGGRCGFGAHFGSPRWWWSVVSGGWGLDRKSTRLNSS